VVTDRTSVVIDIYFVIMIITYLLSGVVQPKCSCIHFAFKYDYIVCYVLVHWPVTKKYLVNNRVQTLVWLLFTIILMPQADNLITLSPFATHNPKKLTPSFAMFVCPSVCV
jgi:hypothetical protein